MRKSFHLLTFLLLIGNLQPLFAQDHDFGTHVEAEISKKLSKRIDLQFAEELRFNQNITEFDRSLATLAASYSLNKVVKAGLFYTWIYANNQDDGYYESRHRFGGWIQASHKINRFRFTVREKFQNTYRDENLGNFKYNPKMYLRSKLEASYNIKKMPLKPYFSTEMFYQLNNPYGNEIDKWRFTLGSEYSFNKKFSVSPFLRIDKEVNVKNPLTILIAGSAVKFQF